MLLSEIWYVVLCVLIAFRHKWLIKHNIQYSHDKWTILYFAFAALSLFVYQSLWQIATSVLIHEVVFSPFLNLIRGKSFWYVNVTDPNGSELDKLEINFAKPVYFLCLATLILIQFLIFHHELTIIARST